MKDFILFLPEAFLIITLAGVILGEIGYRGEKTRLTSATALVGLVGAFIQTLLMFRYGVADGFGRVFAIDGLALFFKLFAILLAVVAVITSLYTKEIAQEKRAEYCSLIIASALAMCVAASATDLLLVFLALQLLNVLGHFLSAHGKRSILSAEAAVKHFAFGAVAAVLLLYGIAILFAHTHVLNLHDMHQALIAAPLSREISAVVFVLIFLALSFQIGAFPMYLWVPDVLAGAPTPASAFLSLAPRAAGFVVAIRVFMVVFAQPAAVQGEWQVLGEMDWTSILAVISGITVVVGAFLALRQQGAKRLIAALVVAESGFLLLGLLVLNEVGVAALLYNLVVELFALMGAFYVISFFIDQVESDRLSDLKGLLGRAVPESVCLILFLACLVGLPPLPGFIGKFTLIGAAVRHGWYALAVVSMLSATVSTVAVARLAYSLVGDFRSTTPLTTENDKGRRICLAALCLPIVLIGIFAELVLGWAAQVLRLVSW